MKKLIILLLLIIILVIGCEKVSDIEIKAQDYCSIQNIDGVYVCGNYIKTISSLLGGGSTFYEENLNVSCPIVGPDYVTQECKNLSELNCTRIC